MTPMTPEEKQQIDNMTHMEVCSLWRFGKVGHPFLDSSNESSQYFVTKFKELGGFTSEISKELGW